MGTQCVSHPLFYVVIPLNRGIAISGALEKDIAMAQNRKFKTKTSAIGSNAGFVLLPRQTYNQYLMINNQLQRQATSIGVAGVGGGLSAGKRRGRPPASQNVTIG